jgi:hypothetical protein
MASGWVKRRSMFWKIVESSNVGRSSMRWVSGTSDRLCSDTWDLVAIHIGWKCDMVGQEMTRGNPHERVIV